MILDTSAVIAVMRRESDYGQLVGAMTATNELAIGAPTMVEAAMVATGRFGEEGRSLFGHFLDEWDVEVVPFDARHWRVASDAFVRYGKGRHPAGLNYGDCMTYATARLAEMPLLFTGDDFAKTDIPVA